VAGTTSSRKLSFPEELRRTKPYGYSLFNLDAMTTVCQIVSSSADNLWTYELSDGCGIRQAVAFLFPYIENKKLWPYKPDVMYHDKWPMRHRRYCSRVSRLGSRNISNSGSDYRRTRTWRK